MLSDGKDFILSLVVSMGYCIEVVDKGGQGVVCTLGRILMEIPIMSPLPRTSPTMEVESTSVTWGGIVIMFSGIDLVLVET